MSPSIAAVINLLLILNQLISVAQANRASSSTSGAKQISSPSSAGKPTTTTISTTTTLRPPSSTNDTSGVDEILRDTLDLLDSLDQKLTQVSNKTNKSDSRELRSLDEIERDLVAAAQQAPAPASPSPVGQQQQKDQQKSLIVPNLFSKIASQQQQQQQVAASNSRQEDDDKLTQLAEQFSPVRKSAAAAGADKTDLATSASNSHEHHHHQVISSPISSTTTTTTTTTTTSTKKTARQLNFQQDEAHSQQASLGKFDNNFTEKHIRFTLDMMQAIFASQSSGATMSKPNSIDSFLISPVSIQLVLMMMHLGARGQTKRELSNTLHFLNSSPVIGNLSTASATESSGVPVNATQALHKNAKLTRRHQMQPGGSNQPKLGNQAKAANGPPPLPAANQQTPLNNNVHEQFGAAIRQLLKDPTVVRALTSANQIFLQKDLPLSAQYEWAVKHYYGSDLRQVDFQSQSVALTNSSSNSSSDIQQMINDWVERQTRGKISNFLTSPVPTSTLLIALNVLFYKGDWQYKFDPADTDPDAWFTRVDGKTVKVPMMVNKLPLAHAYDPAMKTSMIELPYKAQRLGLFIMLPDEVNGIFETMQMLNSSSFANLISMMRKPAPGTTQGDLAGGGGGGINVRIPKFSIESSPRLSQILSQQLGLKTLFSPDVADLSGMFATNPAPVTQKRSSLSLNQTSSQQPTENVAQAPLQVGLDELLHKAVLQVHEQGSVAAAASATIVERVGLFNGQYFEADHPFLVFLMDKQTGLVLFSGVFAGPGGETATSSQHQGPLTSVSAPNSTTLGHLQDGGHRSPQKIAAR